MKTLVTGGAGFIGSSVVKQLLDHDIEVKVLHLPNERLDNLAGLDVELIPGNILNKQDIEHALKDCNKVYHMAAIYALWLPKPQLMFDVNVEGSRNVFSACLKNDIEKIVYTSSLVRFAGQGKGNICNEDSPFRFGDANDQYSISKFRAHEVAEDFANNKALNLTIVCPSLPVGPGDIGPTPTGKYVVHSFTAPVLTYANNITNIADVRDIANGHLLAMEKGQKGRSYILGNPQNVTMEEFTKICLRLSNRKIPIVKIPNTVMRTVGLGMQLNSIFLTRKPPLLTYEAAVAGEMGLAANCSRAIAELGYTCRPLQESLKDALDWFKMKKFI